jgi:hypothetical protein
MAEAFFVYDLYKDIHNALLVVPKVLLLCAIGIVL